MHRFPVDGNNCPEPVVFLINASVAGFAACLTLPAGHTSGTVLDIGQSAIEFVAVFGTYKIRRCCFFVGKESLCDEFMEVNGFRFILPVCLFPGFLEDRATTRVLSQVVDEVDLNQVSVRGQVFIDWSIN
jgi:hypothetical protein